VEVAALQEVEDNNGDINFKRYLTMKKIITLATLGLLVAAAPISAQTVYDAAKITGKDLNGTARFVGMGGAMGALGGDISTIGTKSGKRISFSPL
jgi:predicted transcriptional regulator